MRCTHCGTQLPEGSVFCISCHSMLEEEGKPADVPVPTLGNPVDKKPAGKSNKPLFTTNTILLLIGAFVVVVSVTAIVVYQLMK